MPRSVGKGGQRKRFGKWLALPLGRTLMHGYWIYPALFVTGLSAGFVDSIAGGGGLITLPVLLSLGLEPKDALGTNKLQASFGTGSATWHYACAKAVDWHDSARGFVFSFLGAALGSFAVQQLARSVLERVIPFLLM